MLTALFSFMYLNKTSSIREVSSSLTQESDLISYCDYASISHFSFVPVVVTRSLALSIQRYRFLLTGIDQRAGQVCSLLS